MITVRESTAIKRNDILGYLERHGIQTRNLFAGNLLKQPCFDEMRQNNTGFRMIGDLRNTDLIMNNTFWIGVYPGMTDEMLEYMICMIRNYCSS